MRQLLTATVLACSLAACETTKPIPDGYRGPIAHIQDSTQPRGQFAADIFYLSKIDGKPIDQSLSETRQANYGRGFALSPVAIGREVPARQATFTIVGRTHHAAPILSLLNREYELAGDVEFAPSEGRRYRVKGTLGDDYSAVWVEDIDSGAQVGRKVETTQPTSLNMFQK